MSQTLRVFASAVLLAVLANAAAVAGGGRVVAGSSLGGAGVQLESATLGPVAQPAGIGWVVGTQTLVGWKFTVNAPFTVTGVGGHLVSRDAMDPPQTIFVAIVPLGQSGLPVDTSLADDAVFAATFDVDSPSAEITVATGGVLLQPGTYGMIFGSGQFGADGLGNMPGNDTDVGSPAYFFCDVLSGCLDGGLDSARFFVNGTPFGPEIFSDGFESGDTSAWSSTSP